MLVTLVVGLVASWWWVLVAWSCPAGGPGDAEDLVGLVVGLVATYWAGWWVWWLWWWVIGCLPVGYWMPASEHREKA